MVIESELLGFDILLEMDIIKKLNRVCITELGEVRFTKSPICAAININKLDFRDNKHTEIWIASWKWSDRHPPGYRKIEISEYPVSKQAKSKYQCKLKT